MMNSRVEFLNPNFTTKLTRAKTPSLNSKRLKHPRNEVKTLKPILSKSELLKAKTSKGRTPSIKLPTPNSQRIQLPRAEVETLMLILSRVKLLKAKTYKG